MAIFYISFSEFEWKGCYHMEAANGQEVSKRIMIMILSNQIQDSFKEEIEVMIWEFDPDCIKSAPKGYLEEIMNRYIPAKEMFEIAKRYKVQLTPVMTEPNSNSNSNSDSHFPISNTIH